MSAASARARLDAAERDCPAPWSEDGVSVLSADALPIITCVVGDFCAPWAVKARDLIAHAPDDLRLALDVVDAVAYDAETGEGHVHVIGFTNLCTCTKANCKILIALDALNAAP